MKNILECKGRALGYFILFLSSQSIIGIIAFLYFALFNSEYQNYFITNMNKSEYNPLTITNMLLGPITNIIIGFSSIFIIFIITKKMIKRENLKALFNELTFGKICSLLAIGVLFNILVSSVLYFLPDELLSTSGESTSLVLHGNFILVLLVSGIIAPIAEELIFRYGMMNNLIKIDIKYGIIYQAAMFGFIHGNLVQGVYTLLFGLLLGVICYKSKNILYPIFIHIGLNTSSIIVANLTDNISILFVLLVIMFTSLIVLAKTHR